MARWDRTEGRCGPCRAAPTGCAGAGAGFGARSHTAARATSAVRRVGASGATAISFGDQSPEAQQRTDPASERPSSEGQGVAQGPSWDWQHE